MPAPDDETPDVLPPIVTQILSMLWILLFAGRWLASPWLMSSALTAELDQRILFPIYLVLLIITLAVIALRAVRRSARPAAVNYDSDVEDSVNAESRDQAQPSGPPISPQEQRTS